MGTSGGIRIALVIVLALSVIPFSRIDAGILPAFADSDPSAKMNPWSPSTAGIPGQTTFTFSADATASAGLARVEWDFDGDGGVDATTLLAGQNHVNGLTTSYVYSSDGIFWPQVRSVDLAGQYSGWDRYRSSGNDVPLIVSWPAPFITMLQWQPFNVAAGQTVTFSATAFNPVGIQGFEWDLDGDNMPDTFTPADVPGATSASGSVQWVFTGALAAFPQVRALDNDGFLSTWDIYDINGQPVQMVVGGGTPPAVTMNQWAPYSATGPDGQPSTVFSFSADASSSAGLASVEWDFGGDGVPDHVESLAGQTSMTVTASHTYGQVGSWVPTVRVVDINGLDSGWTPYLVGGQPVALDTAAAPSTLAVTLNFTPRAASDVGPDGTTATAFTFTATASNPAVSYAWDFDGDASVDLTTTVPTATHTYPAAGSYLASVTVTDNLGQVKSTTALDSLGGGETVDVSPTAPVATMNQWAPYSATGPDGHERTPFTFSASASASAGVKKIEWDFDGDGVVDATTNVSGSPASASATRTYTYHATGTFYPQVRAVDGIGQVSPWDQYDVNSLPVALDIVNPPPTVTMNQWVPYNATGPDGFTDTVFTLSADATCQIGLAKIDWDFDGNGSIDATTTLNSENSVSGVTVQTTFGTAGNYTPKVRSTSITGLMSPWDSFNIGPSSPVADIANPPPNAAPVADAGPDQIVLLGSTVTLDGTASSDSDPQDSISVYSWRQASGPISVTLSSSAAPKPTFLASAAGTYVFELKVTDSRGLQGTPDTVNILAVNAPTATLTSWSPYSASGPDGPVSTTFTFYADAQAEGGIARLEWDFDGDGGVDAITAIAGAPATVSGRTATFQYSADGTYTPKVRVVDVGGNVSAWDPLNSGTTVITLDVLTPVGSATMNQWAPYSATGPDGTPSTNFSFSSSGSANLGILRFEWDLDGNGSVDAATAIAGAPTSATATSNYVYGVAGTFTPQVRVVDVSGTAWPWDAYNVGPAVISLETASPPPPAGDLYCNGMTIEQLIASGQYSSVIDNRGGPRKTLVGTHGNDLIIAGSNGDHVNGLKGDDCIIGGSGNDTLNGNYGNDQIYGNGGNDRIRGNNGNDVIYGGAGNDRLYGNGGNDRIYGGDGNDFLHGGGGRDQLDGGAGHDVAWDGDRYDGCESRKRFDDDEGSGDDGRGDDDDDDDNGDRHSGNAGQGDGSSNSSSGGGSSSSGSRNDRGDNGHGNDSNYSDNSNPGKSGSAKGKSKNK